MAVAVPLWRPARAMRNRSAPWWRLHRVVVSGGSRPFQTRPARTSIEQEARCDCHKLGRGSTGRRRQNSDMMDRFGGIAWRRILLKPFDVRRAHGRRLSRFVGRIAGVASRLVGGSRRRVVPDCSRSESHG